MRTHQSLFRALLELMFTNIIIFLVITIFCSITGGFLWPYALNSWLIFAGKSTKVTFLNGMLLGAIPVFGFLQFPITVITWIAMLFLI